MFLGFFEFGTTVYAIAAAIIRCPEASSGKIGRTNAARSP